MDDGNWTDKLAITELVQRWSDALNRNRWDELEATLAPDAVWDLVKPFPIRIEGARAIRDTIEERCAPLDLLFQVSLGTVVSDIDASRARATTMVQELARQPETFSFLMRGIYYDELVKIDGAWRFATRRFQGVHLDPTPIEGKLLATRGELS
jgi:hypothetical protein